MIYFSMSLIYVYIVNQNASARAAERDHFAAEAPEPYSFRNAEGQSLDWQLWGRGSWAPLPLVNLLYEKKPWVLSKVQEL